MTKMGNSYKIKTGRKRPPGKPRHKWEGNITMAAKEAGRTDPIGSGHSPMKA
jgi:hypothetical protein